VVQEAGRHLTSSWPREHEDTDGRVMRDRIQALVQAWPAVAAARVVVEDPEIGQRGLYAAKLGLLQQHAQLVHVLGNLLVIQALPCGGRDLEFADHSKIRQAHHPRQAPILIRCAMDIVRQVHTWLPHHDSVQFDLAAGTIASVFHAKVTTATIRRQLIAVPGRLAKSARRLVIHLPRDWPWQDSWEGLFNAACGPPAPATT